MVYREIGIESSALNFLRAEVDRLRAENDYLLALLRQVEDEWDDGGYLTRALRAEIRDQIERKEIGPR
jgi:hypothetical protein